MKHRVCTQCGKDKAPTTWQFCSFECKENRTKEYTAKGARTRREKTARRVVANPIAQAIETGDRDTILRVIRGICTISPRGCWIPRETFGAEGERQVYNSGGYRRVMLGTKNVILHRLTLETAMGASLGKTPVHHRCSVRACCNPEHLQPTTLIENNLEMMERTGYRARIADLESALRELEPGHPLLWARRD